MGNTNQFGTNTCHCNKKLNQILNYLQLFWDFPKSLINEYSDGSASPEFIMLKLLVRENKKGYNFEHYLTCS